MPERRGRGQCGHAVPSREEPSKRENLSLILDTFYDPDDNELSSPAAPATEVGADPKEPNVRSPRPSPNQGDEPAFSCLWIGHGLPALQKRHFSGFMAGSGLIIRPYLRRGAETPRTLRPSDPLTQPHLPPAP